MAYFDWLKTYHLKTVSFWHVASFYLLCLADLDTWQYLISQNLWLYKTLDNFWLTNFEYLHHFFLMMCIKLIKFINFPLSKFFIIYNQTYLLISKPYEFTCFHDPDHTWDSNSFCWKIGRIKLYGLRKFWSQRGKLDTAKNLQHSRIFPI